ncbi:DNA polymerase III subunit delta' [Thermaurantimonas aggregans]|uniref:DNA polymerase III subunit delta n=1 Tax=Thermaurantimonas aggregans TaxID=2173829 RepID=A0A401XMR9_9FLAO|nr:DNA polymerase III subunit delta' [Thermaurantimonas aggregans]MCX8149411.1 hypothetical protein [Thermaurantimonas aggregans]GCD78293.1 DNA polymerase III subunit delta' [Thermaurantimonas aggregans]
MWNFSKLFSNRETVENLKANVREGRVSHAQIFFGKEGSEALPAAFAYIKYIFCENRTEYDSCGTCTYCKQVDSLNHPDLKIIFPFPYTKGKVESSTDLLENFLKQFKKNPYLDLFKFSQKISAEKKSFSIPTSECESLNKFLGLKSFYGGKKVALIWYPELINTAGANKILKTIEEPSGDTLILLVSYNLHDVLPTVLSRCQVTHLKAPTVEEISVFLKENFENISHDNPEILLQISDGNIGSIVEILSNNNPFEEFEPIYSVFIEFIAGNSPNKHMLYVLEKIEFLNTKGREFTKHFLNFFMNKIHDDFLIKNRGNFSMDILIELQNLVDHYTMLVERNISIKMAIISLLIGAKNAFGSRNKSLLIQENILV